MRLLEIKDFACLKNASIEMGDFTLLIGPQASGKSILSKLCYFFQQIIIDVTRHIEDDLAVADLKDYIRAEFIRWFPIFGWGSGRFVISFSAGPLTIRLTRVQRKGETQDNFQVRLSPTFEAIFSEYAGERKAAIAAQALTGSTRHQEDEIVSDYQALFEVRRKINNDLAELLGKDFTGSQIFVPAGRSFFTSLGRAVAAFEQGQILDPVTARFGRIFTSMKDRPAARLSQRRGSEVAKLLAANAETFGQLFGGKIKFERNREYIKLEDGREIPFSSLSSGQQELLPIWQVLNSSLSSGRRAQQIIYIEEPEAHLFPIGQSAITQVLSSIAATKSLFTSLFVTTHSPYVLTTVNNLMFAYIVYHSVAEIERPHIAEIYPVASMLDPDEVRAYCISEGQVFSIMGDDNLIDAGYLDEISENISTQFDKLLERMP